MEVCKIMMLSDNGVRFLFSDGAILTLCPWFIPQTTRVRELRYVEFETHSGARLRYIGRARERGENGDDGTVMCSGGISPGDMARYWQIASAWLEEEYHARSEAEASHHIAPQLRYANDVFVKAYSHLQTLLSKHCSSDAHEAGA